MIDRFGSVFIPSLGWFHLKPGDPIAESLAAVASQESANCVASGKLTFEAAEAENGEGC